MHPPPPPWQRSYHIMTKPAGARCNLKCTYCFYLEKQTSCYPEVTPAATRMSDEVLEAYVREHIATQPGDEVVFAWQGGEPTLMGVEFFRKAVALQKRYANGRRIANAFQTNGTLLDEEWARFFAEAEFLVGISIDGPKAMHDAYRIHHGGRPTWDRVMEALRLLRRHRVQFNTLTVVHRRNVKHAAAVYAFLKKEGSGFMQFIPLVERRPSPADTAAGLDHAAPADATAPLVPPSQVAQAVAPECPAPEDFGRFMSTIFDQWVRHDVGRVFVQTFDVILPAWLGSEPAICVFNERCGRALALEHNGDVYACDHYVYPKYKHGNILATPLAGIVDSPAAAAFGAAKAILPPVCLRCPVRFVCNGDCPKHRFVSTGENSPGLSYLCAGYKLFFTHIDPAMRRIAALLRQGLPASEIMRGGW